MAYTPKSKRNSKLKSGLSQKELDNLSANQQIDDIHALSKLSNQHELDIQELQGSKQDNLVSGENIATINGESILEGNNIDLPTKCFTIAMSVAL